MSSLGVTRRLKIGLRAFSAAGMAGAAVFIFLGGCFLDFCKGIGSSDC
jgi:hypothetical protein